MLLEPLVMQGMALIITLWAHKVQAMMGFTKGEIGLFGITAITQRISKGNKSNRIANKSRETGNLILLGQLMDKWSIKLFGWIW